MKFIRKKVIKGKEYYYFQYSVKIRGIKRTISTYIGSIHESNIRELIKVNLEKTADLVHDNIDDKSKKYFYPKSASHIEKNRFWYLGMHHELFGSDFALFRSLFATLFILNSNRAEGSKVTRKDIEKIINRKQKPKTLIDFEVIDSLDALAFAFSKKMKWNLITIKKLHGILLKHLAPKIAGEFKKVDNVVNNQPTSAWKDVRTELQLLLVWFKKNRKVLYPPIVALTFHYRFEKIHPFEDGNGRMGRLLANAYLLQEGYMPTIFFSENHTAYCNAIQKAIEGRPLKLAHYFIDQTKKTRHALEAYKKEGILRGGSTQVGRWEIERGKIRKY